MFTLHPCFKLHNYLTDFRSGDKEFHDKRIASYNAMKQQWKTLSEDQLKRSVFLRDRTSRYRMRTKLLT